MEVRFDGLNEVMRNIENLANAEMKDRAVEEGAEYFKRKLSVNTPRSDIQHSHAADNIVVDKDGENRDIGYDKDHYWMEFLEFGTKKMPAQPVVAPTFENESDNVEDIITEAIRRELGL